MPTHLLLCFLALASAAGAHAGLTDILLNSDPEAQAFGGSAAPPVLTDTPRADFPTTLRHCGRARMSCETTTQVPLTIHRRAGTIARLDTHATTLRLAAPVIEEPGNDWFLGWRISSLGTAGYYVNAPDDTIVDSSSHERAFGLAWTPGNGWTIGVAATDYALDLDVTGATVDDWVHARPGQGLLDLDLDTSAYTVAVERRAGARTWGLQHSERPCDAFFETEISRTIRFLGAWDGTMRTWNGWYAHDRGGRRWFAWATTSSLQSGRDPLAAWPLVRGRMAIELSAATVGVGMRQLSPNTTTQLELSFRHNDLMLDAWFDQGLLPGGLTGRLSLDAMTDMDSLALRYGRREYHGPWRLNYALGMGRSRFDFYGYYIDSPGLWLPRDEEWGRQADDAVAWTLALTAGTGYRTEHWELAATCTLIGALVDADFQRLDPADPKLLHSPGSHGPSTTYRPGYIFGLTWTWMP